MFCHVSDLAPKAPTRLFHRRPTSCGLLHWNHAQLRRGSQQGRCSRSQILDPVAGPMVGQRCRRPQCRELLPLAMLTITSGALGVSTAVVSGSTFDPSNQRHVHIGVLWVNNISVSRIPDNSVSKRSRTRLSTADGAGRDVHPTRRA